MNGRHNLLILFFPLLLLPVILLAGPLRFAPQKLVQPNGDTVKCFASGNEYYHWLHDKNGYTITLDPVSKYWVYAQKQGPVLTPTNYIAGKDNPELLSLPKWLKPDNNVIKARLESKSSYLRKNKSVIASENSLTKGTINNIAVFIRFRDQQEFSKPLTYYRNKFDGLTDTSISLKNYYYSVSYKQLTVASSFYPTPGATNIVSFQDVHKRDYYRNQSVVGDSGYADVDRGYARLSDLLKRSITTIAPQVSASLNLDADSDGKIDNVIFIIEGAVDGWDDVLWPFQDKADFTAYINSKKVGAYNVQLDDELSTSVLCHEMFHSLGAPDLYHYNNYSVPVGPWDLMEDDANQNMTAYMKYKYGKWIALPAEITQAGTYTLKPLGGSDTANVCYKIKSPNSTKEYFMVEYRDKTMKYESNLPASGIIIYRINTNQSGKGNEDGPPDELYIFRPGGTTSNDGDIENAAFSPSFGRISFNDQTDPKCFLSNGGAGGISISDIKINGTTASFYLASGTTGIKQETAVPNNYSLSQNYPNPFNPSTTIKYSLPPVEMLHATSLQHVTLRIYDVLGRIVATLVDENKSPGNYTVSFPAGSNSMPSGIYLYTLHAGNYFLTKKMILLK